MAGYTFLIKPGSPHCSHTPANWNEKAKCIFRPNYQGNEPQTMPGSMDWLANIPIE